MKNINNTKIWIKADNGKLKKVIEWGSGRKVEIPINSAGTVKWFDDERLLKPEKKKTKQ